MKVSLFAYFFFLLTSFGALADSRNLTPGATARQSTTFPVNLPDRTDAGLAIDGNLTDETTTAKRNRTSTLADDPNPWVEVTLERDAFIEFVEVVNISAGFDATSRSFLRDVTIDVKDASGIVIATSGLLNPTTNPLTIVDSISHTFDLSVPARSVRITRTPDASFPLGDRRRHQFYTREIFINGEFTDPEPVRPFSIGFDSRGPNPDPGTQGFQQLETGIGSDGTPQNGFIDGASANSGLIIDGEETVWQIFDGFDDDDFDSPWNRQHFSDDELKEMFELGWEFTAEVKALTPQAVNPNGNAGFTGWGYKAANNPGWATTGDRRIGFDFGRTADDKFFVKPSSDAARTVFNLSYDEYHTIRAVGLPGATTYEWYVDDQLGGTGTFHPGALGVRGVLVFGSGSTNTYKFSNWKRVSLTSTPGFESGSLDDGLRFYLPFDESGFLVERAAAPLEKPQISVGGAGVVAPAVGIVGQGAAFPGTAHLDAGIAAESISGFPAVTLSAWFKLNPATGFDVRTLMQFDGPTGDTCKLSYNQNSNGDGTNGSIFYICTVGGASRANNKFATGISDGAWHHAAVTISASGQTIIYFDGEKSGALADHFLSANLDQLTMGNDETGSLDEIAIWDRALSEGEIGSLYHLGRLCGPLTRDIDGDGLNSAEEVALGSSDTNIDSDGDGNVDSEEALAGTNAAMEDTDGDGDSDSAELVAGTDPRRADSDGDGTEDGADPAPLDASVFPTPVLPPVPSLAADGDSDGSSDFAEVLVGTNPALAGSKPDTSQVIPGLAIIEATSSAIAQNGEMTFNFTVAGVVENLHIEASTDLQDFHDAVGAVIIDDESGEAVTRGVPGSYTTVITPPAGRRYFIRASGDSAAGTVSSLVTNMILPQDAEGNSQNLIRVTEGSTYQQMVQFSEPYTGHVGYAVAGLAPDGTVLPVIEHSFFVNNSTSATIPLAIFNDLVPGSQARYTISLSTADGLAAGLDSTVTIVVEDDDHVWSGVLSINEELVNIVLEDYTDGTINIQQLTAPDTSSILPKGTFPVASVFDFDSSPKTFSLNAANIPLTRESTSITLQPAVVTSLQLDATDGNGSDLVLPTRIRGAVTALDLKPSKGNAANYTGTFDLIKRPTTPPSVDLNLELSTD